MSEETRICKGCCVEKPLTCFYKQGGINNHGNRHWRCSKCYNQQGMASRAANPERLAMQRARVKSWKEANPEAAKTQNRRAHKRWRENNPETYRRKRKEWKRKNRRLLGNSYIAKKLGMLTASVPAPLLDAMRQVLKANRILWRLQKRTPIKNASETK